MTLESIINTYLAVFTWIIDNVFFFVTVDILKLFALSFLIMSLMHLFEVKKKWIKWLVGILYGLYCVLKILPIRNFVLYFDWAEFPNILPYFCMIILPTLLQKTRFGKILLTYYTISVYYLIINVMWISLVPEAGNLVVMIVYASVIFVIAQLGGLEK